MARETLKPCPFCGAELKPFISTHEVTTVDGKKIGEIERGYWAHPDDSKCPLGFGFSLALEEADSWNHREKEDNIRVAIQPVPAVPAHVREAVPARAQKAVPMIALAPAPALV